MAVSETKKKKSSFVDIINVFRLFASQDPLLKPYHLLLVFFFNMIFSPPFRSLSLPPGDHCGRPLALFPRAGQAPLEPEPCVSATRMGRPAV